MGVASLVLGIISLIMSFIPFVGIFFSLLAIVSIILGIVSLCKKQDKGKSIAGIIMSSIAIIITIFYVFVIGGIIAGISDGTLAQKAEEVAREIENDYSNYYKNTINSKKTIQKQYTVEEKYEDDELAITFLSKDTNFTEYDEYANIKDGYKIVKAEFEFENMGDKNKYISSYNFDCYADGYDCDSFWSVEKNSFSSTLSSGKKTRGAVYFEVPINSESIILEYEVNFLTDEKVEFIIK